MVGVPGDAVGPEREDRVGLHRRHDRHQLAQRVVERHIGAPAVGKVEEPLFRHPERGAGAGHLDRAQRTEAGARELGVVGALLAPGGMDEDHPLAVGGGRGHDRAAQVGLVIGVGPDAEDGAEVPNRLHAGHDDPEASGSTSTTCPIDPLSVPIGRVAPGHVNGDRRLIGRRLGLCERIGLLACGSSGG